MEFTQTEMNIIADFQLREDQLKNLRKVINGSITPKKLEKIEKEVLPGYLLRHRNAQSKAEKIMKKKGYRYK